MQPPRQRVLAVLAVLAVLLGGCTDADPEPRAAAVPSGAETDLGVRGVRSPSTAAGGTLRVVAGTPDSLDPARSYFPWVWNIMRLYTRTLVTYAAAAGPAGAELVPDLATDTGISTDGGRTWTYTLKPDQHFEDGSVITAQDVKYGIERSFASDVVVGGPTYVVDLLDDPANVYGGPYTDPDPGNLGLASIETPDERTLVFRLNRPFLDFDHVMALPSSSPVPPEADTGADYGEDPVSSGPYTISGVDPVLGLTLDRNPGWDRGSDPVRTALPDRIEIRTGLSGADRDQRVVGGSADLDVMPSGVQPDVLVAIDDDPGLRARADRTSGGTLRMLALPAGVAPMDDVHCRRAVALAIDRTRLTDQLGSDAAVAAAAVWPRALPGAGPAAEVPGGPDPAAARRELAACGRPAGFSTTLATPNEPRPLALARAVADDLARVDIVVDVVGLDPATYYGEEIGRPDNVAAAGYGLLLTAWSGDLPTPATYFPPLVSAVQPTGNANYAEIVDPAVTAQVDAALAAPDAAAAAAAWMGLDAALVAAAAYVPLVEDVVTALAGERLRNGVLHTAYGSYDLAVAGVR